VVLCLYDLCLLRAVSEVTFGELCDQWQWSMACDCQSQLSNTTQRNAVVSKSLWVWWRKVERCNRLDVSKGGHPRRHMHHARSPPAAHPPGAAVSHASLRSPALICHLKTCDNSFLRTFILTLSNALSATHQAELGCAPRRLAQVIYFRHAAGLRHVAFLLLHTTCLVFRVLLLLQRSFP
jgi:hypothetical protein